MDLFQLEMFLAVAEERSFSRARIHDGQYGGDTRWGGS